MFGLKKIIILIFFIQLLNLSIFGQLDSVLSKCEQYLDNNYISDGQQYMSLISGEQMAEFNVIFYGGNTYRVISCGGTENDLVFIIYDKYRNELFNSSEYNHTNYWDFQFESTIECFVETKFSHTNGKSGFVVLLIGLKK